MSALVRALKAELALVAADNPAVRRRLGQTARHPLSIPEAKRVLFLSQQRELLEATIFMDQLDRTLRKCTDAVERMTQSMKSIGETLRSSRHVLAPEQLETAEPEATGVGT